MWNCPLNSSRLLLWYILELIRRWSDEFLLQNTCCPAQKLHCMRISSRDNKKKISGGEKHTHTEIHLNCFLGGLSLFRLFRSQQCPQPNESWCSNYWVSEDESLECTPPQKFAARFEEDYSAVFSPLGVSEGLTARKIKKDEVQNPHNLCMILIYDAEHILLAITATVSLNNLLVGYLMDFAQYHQVLQVLIHVTFILFI